MCFRCSVYIPLLTERDNLAPSYKHFAPPEQEPRTTEGDFLFKAVSFLNRLVPTSQGTSLQSLCILPMFAGSPLDYIGSRMGGEALWRSGDRPFGL